MEEKDNIPQISIMPVEDLNAGDICGHQKMLFTKEALLSLMNKNEVSEN